MRVWRITGARHAQFDGEGTRRYGSRWTPKGFAVVYASATLSLAALERFVHIDPDLESLNLVAIPVDVGRAIRIDAFSVEDLPPDWRAYPAPESLARLGAEWAAAARTAVLAVPSVIIPHEQNFLLNPSHPDCAGLAIGKPEPFSFDSRMWAKRRSK